MYWAQIKNDDPTSSEATDPETAQDGTMNFTYTIVDDDDPPFAFFKNVDGNCYWL